MYAFQGTPEPRFLFSRKLSKDHQEKIDSVDKKNKNFVKVIKKGNIDNVKDILQGGFNGFRYDNDFCLDFCVSNGYFHLVKVLVEYGYMRVKNERTKLNLVYDLAEIFKRSIQSAVKHGELKILKFLIQKSDDIERCKEYLSYVLLNNFNPKINYNNLEISIQERKNVNNAKEVMNKNVAYNKAYDRNRPLNISMYHELLIGTEETADIGIDYNSSFKHLNVDDEPDSEPESELEAEDDIEDDPEDEDDIEAEEEPLFETDEPLFETEELEPEPELKTKRSPKSKDSTIEKMYTKHKVSRDRSFNCGTKEKNTDHIDTILWLINQSVDVKTDYQFISNYVIRHNIKKTISILKSKKKFRPSISIVDFGNLKIEDDLFGDTDDDVDTLMC